MVKRLYLLGIIFSIVPLMEIRAQDTTLFQRVDNALFSGDYHLPIAGYYHTSSYPVGVYYVILPVGVVLPPLRVSWNCHPDQDYVSQLEYREPVWSIQLCPMIGRCLRLGRGDEYALLGGFDIGLDFVRKSFVDQTTSHVLDKKITPYFSFTPKIGVSWVLFDFFVGYEFVPAYHRLSGWTFGIGFSIPTH